MLVTACVLRLFFFFSFSGHCNAFFFHRSSISSVPCTVFVLYHRTLSNLLLHFTAYPFALASNLNKINSISEQCHQKNIPHSRSLSLACTNESIQADNVEQSCRLIHYEDKDDDGNGVEIKIKEELQKNDIEKQ